MLVDLVVESVLLEAESTGHERHELVGQTLHRSVVAGPGLMETLDIGSDVGREEPLAAFTKAGSVCVGGIIEAVDGEDLA